MPLPSLVSAIVSSIVSSAADEAITQATSAPPAPPAVTIAAARNLPENALKGTMMVTGPMSAEVDGQEVLLAPGVQVRNEVNLIVMPVALQQPTTVRYLMDPMGAVSRVWILSAQEADQ